MKQSCVISELLLVISVRARWLSVVCISTGSCPLRPAWDLLANSVTQWTNKCCSRVQFLPTTLCHYSLCALISHICSSYCGSMYLWITLDKTEESTVQPYRSIGQHWSLFFVVSLHCRTWVQGWWIMSTHQLSLVLVHAPGGVTRLSWPVWLITYWDVLWTTDHCWVVTLLRVSALPLRETSALLQSCSRNR